MNHEKTNYIKTPVRKTGARAAKKHEAREFYKGKSILSILIGPFVYIYFEHEVGILRTLLITLSVVLTLNQLLPFWVDLLLSVF